MGTSVRAARAALHFWEEPCISGEQGSGAVFFSGCQLKCVFCQNRSISHECAGVDITDERLAEIFFELYRSGANNINLVSASHFVPSVINAIEIVKKQGFSVPFVYNSSGYESVETLRMLDGYIDIYLPDFKYMSSDYAKKYSAAENYPDAAKKAISEMHRQIGSCVFDGEMMKRGVLVRQLVMPGMTADSKRILKYLFNEYGDDIWISIMNQYTPPEKMPAEISRPVSRREYDEVLDYACEIGIQNAFIQEGGTVDESFIPPFDLEGV